MTTLPIYVSYNFVALLLLGGSSMAICTRSAGHLTRVSKNVDLPCSEYIKGSTVVRSAKKLLCGTIDNFDITLEANFLIGWCKRYCKILNFEASVRDGQFKFYKKKVADQSKDIKEFKLSLEKVTDEIELCRSNINDNIINDAKNGEHKLRACSGVYKYDFTDVQIVTIFEGTRKGDRATVIDYLRKCLDPDVSDNNENTMLHIAAQNGHLQMVKDLVVYGADVSRRNIYRNPALNYAILSNNSEIVDFLVSQSADVSYAINNKLALHFAICNSQNADIVKTLLQNNADITFRMPLGRTVLHSAVETGSLYEIVTSLLAFGADISTKDTENYVTPLLLYLCFHNDTNFVRFLINNGANVSDTDRFDTSALQYAAFKNTPDMIRELIKNGADIDHKSNDSYTAIAKAVLHGKLKNVEELLLYINDVNSIRAQLGQTLLFIAAKKNTDAQIVKVLLKRGADPNVPDNEGNTPLHAAVIHNNSPAIVKELIKSGADVNAKNNLGSTPLHCAATSCSVKLVKEMLRQVNDLKIRNVAGKTALDIAIKNDNEPVIKLLKSQMKNKPNNS